MSGGGRPRGGGNQISPRVMSVGGPRGYGLSSVFAVGSWASNMSGDGRPRGGGNQISPRVMSVEVPRG